MERWLHQHIFKVGWLLTHNFHTTTVLYYTFFLPGVLLHEVVTWLVAGIVNVRAKGAIAWPERQDIGELRLNFVQITQRITPLQQFIISVAPLTVGMLVTWHVANNVFRLEAVLQTMSSGSLTDVSAGINQLVSVPDFWLWFYLLFTISNTMFSGVMRTLSTWRSLLLAGLVILTAVGIVGVTSSLLASIAVSLQQVLTILLEIIVFLIGINLLVTLFLGTVESLIERATGHSATFRKGRMITMTRAEALAEREKDRSRITRRTVKTPRNPAADSHIRSIYALPLPVPGAPTRDATTQLELALPAPAETPAARSPIAINPPLGSPSQAEPLAATPAALSPTPKPARPSTGPVTTEKPPEPARPAPAASPVRPSTKPLFGDPSSAEEDPAQETSAAPAAFARPALSPSPAPNRFGRPAAPQEEAPESADDNTPQDSAPSAPSLKPTGFAARPSLATASAPAPERPAPEPAAQPEQESQVDDEDAEAAFPDALADEPPSQPARPASFSSPFSRPAAPSPAEKPGKDDTAAEAAFPDALADEPPSQPARPASFSSPFSRPAASSDRSPFASSQPGAQPPPPAERPATPRNPAYNQLASRPPSPFQRPAAPLSAQAPRQADDEADAPRKRLLEPEENEDEELRYEKDDEFFYSEDEAEAGFSDDD
jgi:hypothetical protein